MIMNAPQRMLGVSGVDVNRNSEWSEGTELSYAYFSFAESRQREEVQQRSDIGATAALTELMYAALFAKLASGELSAYGFRSEPNPSGHPVELPKYCFVQRPNISDSENDRVISSGVHYDRVTISVNDNYREEVRTQTGIVPEDIEIVDASLVSEEFLGAVDEAFPKTIATKQRGRGRPSLAEPIESALQELFDTNPALIKKSAARLLPEFLKVFPKHAKHCGHDTTSVCEKTLREGLIPFRKKLEKIPSTNFSN